MVRRVRKKFLKAELLSVQLQSDSESCKSLKTIISNRWCEGLHAALSAVLDHYVVIGHLFTDELKTRKEAGMGRYLGDILQDSPVAFLL